MKTIGILGTRGEPHVAALTAAIEKVGAKPQVVDFKAFPRLNLCSYGKVDDHLFDDIRERSPFPLDALDAAIVRTVSHRDLTGEQAQSKSEIEIATDNRQQVAKISFQVALHLLLARRIPVINPPHAHLFHRQKGWQHHLLKKNGIPTPSAIVTNNKNKALAFTRALGGRVVAKPQASGAEVVMANDAFFRRNDRLDRPYMFQQFVKGRAIRAYAIGGKVISSFEIQYDKEYVDWRERIESTKPCAISPALSDQIQAATRLLDLPFCGIDMEYDERTKNLYFLDFNPSAYFVVASRMGGVDIALHLAQYLLGLSENEPKIWN